MYCTSGHCLSKSSLQLMLVSVFTSWNLGNKRTYFAQVGLHCVLLKKIISVQWINSNWFDFIHYADFFFFFFLSKNAIFSYILEIFFAMLHLKIFLEYWIIVYIFRISLCVTSPLEFISHHTEEMLYVNTNFMGNQSWSRNKHFHLFLMLMFNTDIDFLM